MEYNNYNNGGMNQNVERELSWDDQISKEGGDFELIPAGDYDFIVEKFERSRFDGSAKMPACNQATLTIRVFNSQNQTTIMHNLLLHTKTEWTLSEFFTAIGQKKKGEPLRMNWNSVIGASGRCKVIVNKYKDRNGNDRENNRIDKFYAPESQQQSQYQQPQQMQYQQPQQAQQPAYGTNPNQYTPGRF